LKNKGIFVEKLYISQQKTIYFLAKNYILFSKKLYTFCAKSIYFSGRTYFWLIFRP